MAKSAVQSVDRAADILEQLSAGPQEGLRLSELARGVGLRPQTAQSLLRTLEGRGLVAQPAKGGPYVLGYRLWELGRCWLTQRDPADVAGSEVKRVGELLGEHVILVELHDARLVAVAEVGPERSLSVRSQPHTPDRLHTMATAKILLAFSPKDVRDAILADMTFKPAGPAAVTSATALRKQLSLVRAQQCVVCVDESSVGIAAVAVPVVDEAGHVVAAIGSSLPSARFDDEKRATILEELRQAADRLRRNWVALRQ